MTALLVLLVRLYQWTLRPLIGAQCRFAPSCSEYAVEALRVHGPARGCVLALRRILRCNPWHAGGWDPVPPDAAATPIPTTPRRRTAPATTPPARG